MKKGASRTLRAGFVPGLLAFLMILFLAFLAAYRSHPPEPVPANASLTEFSSMRAKRHLEVIARRPHPVGSSEQVKVRGYILRELSAMGLEAEVQKTTSLNLFWSTPLYAGTVHNIVGRLEGTGGDKAILLMAHYDSAPTGPGASDNSVSVATLLETARALRASAPLRNDVILLFTDGEEVGLLGAFAFVDEHPWAEDVGLVVNLEARGISGSSILFETSVDNSWLIGEFAKAVPYPVANSFAPEAYRFLPNATDFTVFREAGFAGFNMAFIKGRVYYHTSLDSIENVDERSIQHQGSCALALTRHFGDLSLEGAKESNEIYFDLFGSVLVHYPGAWVKPLMVLAVLLFAGVVVFGLRAGRLVFSKIVFSFFVFLIVSFVVLVVVTLIWQVICLLHSGYTALPWGDTYNSDLYMVSFVALTAALVSWLYALLHNRISIENLAVGALLWWLILAVLTSLCFPGGSYLFVWPLLFSLMGLKLRFALEEREAFSTRCSILLSIFAVPGVVLLVPTIYLLFLALTLDMLGAVMVAVVLLIGLLIPQLDLMIAPSKEVLPGILALVGLGSIVATSLTSGFDASHPKSNSIFYALNADTKEAIWASADERADEWTSQFIAPDAETSTLPEYFPYSPEEFLQSPAPTVEWPAPDVVLLGDSTGDETRTLRLQIISRRQASSVGVYLVSDTPVLRAVVNGRQVDQNNPLAQSTEWETQWGLWYWALPEEGIELILEVEPSQQIKIRVVDQAYGLLEIPGMQYEPRPEHIIPAPFPIDSDLTLVSRVFTY